MSKKNSSFHWTSLEHDNIDIFATNLTLKVLSIANEYIPYKSTTVRTSGPPWLIKEVKRNIRKRKRSIGKLKGQIWRDTGKFSRQSAMKQ